MARHLLVWDAPNVDMTLANIIEGKPTAKERPDLAVLGNWLVSRAAEDDEVEACVFVNVASHVAGPMRGWVLWLLEQGFRVFAKPKVADSDVDDDMIEHLWERFEEGDLETVYVGSNDARAFLDPLAQLADEGVHTSVLGFAEFAGGLSTADHVDFIDLESIEGLFADALPRLTLELLPTDGRWFEPRGRLGAGTGGRLHSPDPA
ncbi:NYN domain-containing protein [Nitriliruptoraceae bacterium ZYF776]|nr:NYN domain-containing protein [Profundirhabdus halotolerans]